MPYKGGVQLFPESAKRIGPERGSNTYVVLGIVLIAATFVAYVVLGSYQRSLTDTLAVIDGALVNIENQRDESRENKLVDAKRQSELIGRMLSQQTYWSKAFDLVERLMASGISLTTLQASSKQGQVQFTALAPNYASVARQMAAFLSDALLKDVVLTGIRASNAGQLEFSGSLFLTTDALKQAPAAK